MLTELMSIDERLTILEESIALLRRQVCNCCAGCDRPPSEDKKPNSPSQSSSKSQKQTHHHLYYNNF